MIAGRMASDDDRRIARRAETVGEAFTVERAWLHRCRPNRSTLPGC
jgi:hypothetical protein